MTRTRHQLIHLSNEQYPLGFIARTEANQKGTD